MLKRDTVVLEDTEQAVDKTHLPVHQVLANGDHGKTGLACHTGDLGAGHLLGGQLGDDAGTRMLRRVGVADIHRNAHLAHRGHGLVVQYAGAHIGQLTNLGVGHLLHGPGLVDDTRVRHQQARDVGPVLVKHGIGRPCRHRAAHIRAAAGESAHLPVDIAPIESGYDIASPDIGQALAQQRPGPGIHQAIGAYHDKFRGLDEVRLQPGGQQQPAEVFTPGGGKIRRHTAGKRLVKLLQVGSDHRRDTQLPLDSDKALGNHVEGL